MQFSRFEGFEGLGACSGPLTGEAWDQAGLCTSEGGLGIRHVHLHADAAYVASLVATASRCQELDPHYAFATWGPYNSAIAAFNQQVSPADHVALPVPPTFRQQLLSRALDRVTALRLGSAGQGREAFRAHFQLQRQPHAGSWLQAPPCEALGLHVESPLFRIMIRRRLRLPVADEDIPCPLCDPVMDRFGDHALVCACGGDRVKRHNRLRSLLASRAKTAGLDSEVEKPGLLPPRLDAHGGPEDGAAGWRPQTR